jgi:hypothetical protein
MVEQHPGIFREGRKRAKRVQQCVGLLDDRLLIPAAVAVSLAAKVGANRYLYPELRAGVHLQVPHHQHLRRRHLIMSHTLFSSLPYTHLRLYSMQRRQVNALLPSNTSSAAMSRTHTTQSATNMDVHPQAVRWKFLAVHRFQTQRALSFIHGTLPFGRTNISLPFA